MSVLEIIQELPKLTAEERAAILRRLQQLDSSDDSLFLQQTAEAMFREMDEEEAADARRKTR